ncbi:plasma membrane atpase [Ophiostoma piceae UAMH 11346]|uniref:P-type H(+)-exporting transporter n=1 Tax=Ophiostoma piceae (strain UAMH 11346) TaxID=1262450 RepID=S3D5W5_OPHP1|nr:plasma membrane atpase [Ophiostoma piceae UAMH 11346]
MAESTSAAPALNTSIPGGDFDEKNAAAAPAPATKKPVQDDDEDEDIDALIEDLESNDGHAQDDEDEEEAETNVHGGRVIPEEMLQTDTRIGLTEQEVVARRRKYGLNQMKEEKENMILKFFGFFVGPIQFVMEAAAVLAAGLEDWVDFGVICALLLLNAVVGFVQEYQAGSIVDELKKTLALKAVVLRDGTLKEIEAPEVVPGDILQVEEGTIIPADGRIVTEDAFLQTGTLTKNKLSLAEPYTVAGVDPEDLMLTACLAASRKKKGIDAIDKAFLKSLRYYPRAKSVLSKYKVINFFPFDPVSKKVTAIVESPAGERITCVKGAPLFVLKTVEEDHPIPEDVDQAYKNKVAEFATRGFRSLGVARKRDGGSWEILGIMPCSDPPRHDTARTINEAKSLGLSIKMLTGDAVGIARETSRQLGLGTNVYNAERLGLGGGGDMPGSEVYDFVEAADGFAEVFPQHKYNVVEILQQRGYLVAMTGDGVNDAPSLKKADTGIAVEGASDAARSAADIVFLAPGLGAIIDALKTSRQIFHRMYAYVVYRIALSIHLEIYLGLWIAILNRSLNIELVVFIAIFADVATLAIAYDNAPFSKTPVKWNLPKLWGMSVLLGVVLAVGTWITVTTMYANSENGGIVQNFGQLDEVVFLEVSLTENWLIFITRANGPFWSSIPSWQLTGAILIVDLLATFFTLFGFFMHGQQTSIVAVVRIWVFSFGVFCVMAGVYYMLQDSVGFDNLMHGKSPKGNQKQRSLEDFVVSLQRVSTQHEKSQRFCRMPAPFEFPGHYWDEAKGKFFKIESSGTAPAGARWSREEVSHQRQRERIAESSDRRRDQGQIGRGRAGRDQRGRRGGRERPAKRTKFGPEQQTLQHTSLRDTQLFRDAADDTPGDGYIVLPSRICTRLSARQPFLGREANDARTPFGASTSSGRCFESSLRTSAAAWHTRALQYKGTVPVLDEQFALSIEAQDVADLGGAGRDELLAGPFRAALTQPKVLSGTKISCIIKGQYIMTDEDEFVSHVWPDRPPFDKYKVYERSRPEMLSIRRASTISYHESSRNMIVTSSSADAREPIIQVFSPHSDGDVPNDGVTWQLGSTQRHGNAAVVFDGRTIGANSINACVPSPGGFDALCVVGTENGLAVVDLNVGQPKGAFGPAQAGTSRRTTLRLRPPHLQPSNSHSGYAGGASPGYIASLDFVHNHPALVVAGGRFATPWLVDLRENTLKETHNGGGKGAGARAATWRSLRPFTPEDDEYATRMGSRALGHIWNATHVRSVNEHHVVVAGLRNTMVLYDLRYLRPYAPKRAAGSWGRSSSGSVSSSNGRSVHDTSTAAEPLLRFSNYYNSDRMTGLGFAVNRELGIVAAAEEHAPFTGLGGGVGLFSLATGERLAAPSLKSTICHSTETLSRIYPSLATSQPTITTTARRPTAKRVSSVSSINLPRIPALSFSELPGEDGPSLFAGIGANVHKFSARKIREDIIDNDEGDEVGSSARRLWMEPRYNHEVMSLDAEY